MRKCGLWAMALAVAALLALPADVRGAGRPRSSAKPRAVKRHRTQESRIRSGVKDGSLTKGEAGRLIREQKRIDHAAIKAGADGKVTLKEKARLEHMQDKASHHIARERHDKQGEMGPTPDPKKLDPGVNQRQRNQKHRVAQGIRSGSLTRDEAKAIVAQEKEIAKLEHQMKSDGVLTKDERKTLHDMLAETSNLIFAEKHDDETRPKRPPIRKDLAKKIESGEMTKAEAGKLLKDMKRVRELKRLLATAPLSEEKRAQLEVELDTLVSALHE